MPGDSLTWRSSFAVRGIVVVFIVALLLTVVPVALPAAAADLTNRISTNRRSQLYSESVMRQADRSIGQLKRNQKVTKKRIKQSKRAVKQSRRRLVGARRIVQTRAERLRAAESRYAEAQEDGEVEGLAAWKKRLRGLRRDLRIAKANHRRIGRSVRISVRERKARKRTLAAIKRGRRAAISRRESAEAALGARIVEMTRLAQLRAENQTSISLTPGGASFTWPSVGRISQPFGCTGVRWNPPRGSCRHFHDGIDIVAGYGSHVRSAAVGVVAYAGWNPWDTRGRAFVVVVGHPDGYVTRYGHLLPTRRVRVGQLVRQGQTIGRMGNTGFSTGTHLHLELLRGTTPLDPAAYMTSGPVNVREKASRKHRDGRAKASRQRKAKQGRRERSRSGERRQRADRRDQRVADRSSGDPQALATVATPSASAGVFACDVPAGDEAWGLEALTGPEGESPADDVAGPAEPTLFCPDPSAASAPILPPLAALQGDRSAFVPSRGASPIPE